VVAARLGSRTGKTLTGVAAAGELVADKLPGVPSRLGPPGLVPRVALGATSAAATARRDGSDPAVAGLVGLAAAVAGAVLGSRWRAVAQRRLGTDLPGALIEDAATALLAYVGTRRPRTAPGDADGSPAEPSTDGRATVTGASPAERSGT
jgi:uncharacterized membrane protein